MSKLCFQLSVKVYSLLGQTEGCKKGSHIVRLPLRAVGCLKRSKVFPFVKFEIILPHLCFLLDPLTNKHCSTWAYQK